MGRKGEGHEILGCMAGTRIVLTVVFAVMFAVLHEASLEYGIFEIGAEAEQSGERTLNCMRS